MAIIGGMSAPIYSRFLTQNAVSNTVDQLVQDVRKAQFYAMMSRKSSTLNWGVNIDNSTKKITLFQGSLGSPLDEVFTFNNNIIVNPANTTLIFSRGSGIPTSGTFPLTITINGMGNNKTITVNSQGMVTR